MINTSSAKIIEKEQLNEKKESISQEAPSSTHDSPMKEQPAEPKAESQQKSSAIEE